MWFLGFDCATKTFAFSLLEIDLDGFGRARQAMRALKQKIRERTAPPGAVVRELAELDRASRALIRVVDAETADLAPGRADRDVKTPERLKAVARYVRDRVRPALEKNVGGGALEVVIEFQMGANAHTRAVAAALVALFFESKVYFVGPSLKNKVCLGEGLDYGTYCEKYKSSYTAAKQHALANFKQLEVMFCSQLPATIKDRERGHIADSAMQIIGHLQFGNSDAECHF